MFTKLIQVGEFANSDSTTSDGDIKDNTQLGVAAAVFVLFVLFCVLRVFIAKLFGWKLQGVPSGEEEWDSDEPSDDDDYDDDSDDDGDDEEGTRLKRKKSKRKSRKSGRKTMLPTFSSKRASLWGGNTGGAGGGGGKSGEGRNGLEMIDINSTPNPVAVESGIPVSPGRGNVTRKKWGNDSVKVRKSIAEANDILKKNRGAAEVEEGGGVGSSNNDVNLEFNPEEWRRHKDKSGYTFFHHIASGITTYAMPWVLSEEDLAKPLHEANNPNNWRAVETGRRRKDGSPITMYYNTVTKQSTFDLPMFATWGSNMAQKGIQRGRMSICLSLFLMLFVVLLFNYIQL